jgi:DNA-binding CsgD family transcriptional regulator/tetratricopeptide (TPR) repeat protein
MLDSSGLMGGGPGRRGGASALMDRRGERGVLDQLIGAVLAGGSRVLVVRGEPGVGKSALLDYLAGRASGCRVVRAAGVESEMELAFAGLHQLLAPALDRIDRLPGPQREALRTTFGLSAGPPPDRFLVGLAVLGLVSEVAAERPLICVVDDEQWLDRASVQALGFAARRLAADPVGLVFAARVAGAELAGLPELAVEGLGEDDARALLDSALTGPVDAQVRDLIVAETRGNPLALLELPRGMPPAELAGGFGLPGSGPLPGRIEDSFRRQLEGLPEQTRRLLAVAAADPSGDPLLVWRAAGRLGIPVQAGAPAVGAGLVQFGARVRFRHPLARSAAYRSAPVQWMQEVHGALAEATDPTADPDRRAWHQAQAAPGPDEDVAGELQRSAGRAQDRGGLAAAAAFLERAALLTPDPVRRAQRLLSAAWANREAGTLDAALGLLVAAEAGPLDAWHAAEVERLRGQIASDQNRGGDAARLLVSAARRLEPLDAALARETHLEALWAAMIAGDLGWPGGVREAAQAALAAPPGPEPPRAVDIVLDAVALRAAEGYAAAAPTLTRAFDLLAALDAGTGESRRRLADGRASISFAMELWDFESGYALAARQVQIARDMGALVHLQFALNFLAGVHLIAGELSAAVRLMDEDRLIAEATGNPPVGYAAMTVAAWQGREQEASELIQVTAQMATERGNGQWVGLAACASAVLDNGLGRYDAAGEAAWRAFEGDRLGLGRPAVAELAEAAARTGDVALVQAALDWLSERTRVTPTGWVLGIEARVRALASDGQAAESCYRESVERLGRTRIRAELARSHLLYGEWLRRQGRRVDAREQLRTAHRLLEEMGMAAFAERARRELLATGEKVRKRTVPAARIAGAAETLTAQEAQVARLARDGLSNPEIGARLFISPRTAAYHLSNVFTKLGISSRSQLDRVLPPGPDTAGPR